MALQNITYLKPGEEGKIIEGTATQQAANLGLVPVATPNTSAFNSSILEPTPSIPYKEPANVPVYPVANLSSELQPFKLGTEGQKAQDYTTQAQDLINQLLGKSQYTAEQEKAFGVEDLMKTQSDLAGRLKMIQAEAQAIPLQLQQDVTGQGVTAGGLAPIQASRLRANAIQALTTSSLLEAAKGNLSTAQALAERAVSQKYDPIQERLNAVNANLKYVIDSPAYTLEQKQQAQLQMNENLKMQAANEKQRKDEETILSTASEAAKYGADTLTLQKIAQAKTPMEALQYASPYLGKQQEFENALKTGEYNMQIAEMENKLQQQAFENDVALENLELDRAKFTSDEEYRNAQLLLDKYKIDSAISDTGLNPKQTQNFMTISTKYQADPIIKTAGDVKMAEQIADRALANPESAGNQMQLLYAMIKNLDPTSAVREGELALAQSTQSYLDKFRTSFERIGQGKLLSNDAVAELANATKNLSMLWQERAINKEAEYASQAKTVGIENAWNEYKGNFATGDQEMTDIWGK